MAHRVSSSVGGPHGRGVRALARNPRAQAVIRSLRRSMRYPWPDKPFLMHAKNVPRQGDKHGGPDELDPLISALTTRRLFG